MIEVGAFMRPRELVVRCYAEQTGRQWVAVCLDFSLAAQADSFEEVKAKLEAQMREYVYDALVGEDREHAKYLLTRRSPLRFWLRYWLVVLLSKLHNGGNGNDRPKQVRFAESMPLAPVNC